jgi:hypothetical protein
MAAAAKVAYRKSHGIIGSGTVPNGVYMSMTCARMPLLVAWSIAIQMSTTMLAASPTPEVSANAVDRDAVRSIIIPFFESDYQMEVNLRYLGVTVNRLRRAVS